MEQKIIPIQCGYVNCFLIKGEKNILVDTGFEKSVPHIIEKLNENGVEPQDLSLIILTHNHVDHVGGLLKLHELSHAKVLMHINDADFLKEGLSSPVKPRNMFLKLLLKLMGKRKVQPFNPDLKIDDDTMLSEYNIQLIHTPGHTDGSISVLLNNGDVIVGDLLRFKKNKAKLFFIASDIKKMKESIKKLIDIKVKRIYPSHGKMGDGESITYLTND